MTPALAAAVARLAPTEVRFASLLGATLRLLRASGLGVGILGLAVLAVAVGSSLSDQAFGGLPPDVAADPGRWLQTAADAVASAVLTGLILQLWLSGRVQPRAPGLLAYVAVDFASSIAFSAPTLLGLTADPPGLVLDLTVSVLTLYAYASLTPWMLARLTGDGAPGLAESWRLMAGAAWPLVLVIAVLLTVVTLSLALLGSFVAGAGVFWAEPAFYGVADGLGVLVQAAALAIAYQQRVRARERVADLFD